MPRPKSQRKPAGKPGRGKPKPKPRRPREKPPLPAGLQEYVGAMPHVPEGCSAREAGLYRLAVLAGAIVANLRRPEVPGGASEGHEEAVQWLEDLRAFAQGYGARRAEVGTKKEMSVRSAEFLDETLFLALCALDGRYEIGHTWESAREIERELGRYVERAREAEAEAKK